MGKFSHTIPEASKAQALKFNTSEGLELTYLDGDTWVDSSGEKYRLGGGVNLEETAKVIKDGKKTTFKEGHIGGKAALQAMYELQSKGGFNILNDTGERDSYGRRVINFSNNKGEDFATTAIASRIADVNQYSNEEALRALSETELEEELLGKKHEYAQLAEDKQKEIDKLRPQHAPKFKPKALNEAHYAGAPDYYDGVQFRHGGRTIDNKSLNPWTDSWESGWLGVKEGLFGYADLIGQASGIDWLESIGENGVARAQREVQKHPKLLLDYKEIGNVWDGFQFATNNLFMSAPYLAIGLGSALAAPVVGGIATVAGFGTLSGTYIGQFWNEMEGERGAPQMAAAIAGGTGAAVLDKLGISALLKPSQVLTKTGRNRVIKELAGQKLKANLAARTSAGGQVIPKLSQAQATRLATEEFDKASRAQILETINTLGRITSSDIAKFSGVNIAKGSARGFVSESTTEIAQEGLQAATVAGVSDTEYTFDQVKDRLINAGLAGGLAGAGISTAGAIKTEVGQELIRRDLQIGPSKLTALDSVREDDIANGNSPLNVQEVNSETRSRRRTKDVDDDLQTTTSLASEHQKTRRGLKNLFGNIQSVSDGFATVWEGVNRFHRASIETAIPTSLAVSSIALRKLKAKVGNGIVGGTYYSGRNEYGYRDSVTADIESHVNQGNIVINLFKNKRDNDKSQEATSKEIRGFIGSQSFAEVIKAERENREINYDNIEGKYKDDLQNYIDAFKSLRQGYRSMANHLNETSLKQTGKELDTDVKRQYEQWFNLRSADRNKIKKDIKAFRRFLKSTKLMTDGEIDNAIDKIMGGELNDADGSIFSSDFKPWTSKLNRALQEKGGEKFASDNLFETYDRHKDQTAKYVSNAEYYGEGGQDVDQLLQEALDEGVDKDTIAHVAWHVKSIIDSSNGTYNKINNPRIAGLVKMATSWSAIIGLGLSMVSSLPETALIFENIQGSKEKRDALTGLMNEFKQMMTKGINNHSEFYYKSRGQQMVEWSGFPLSTTTAQRRLGVGSTSPAMEKFLNGYFKYIGIQGITAWQRRANAAFGIDYIQNRLENLTFVPRKKDGTLDLKQANRRQQHQYNDLANLGMDVEKVISIFEKSGKSVNPAVDISGRAGIENKTNKVDEDTIADLEDQMQTAIYAFVNQRVQNPQYANRPLLFQDPTLQLFTQFNGFISTFTASALPRIYGNRLLRGTPQVRANTAALIVLMIALGGASQYLKDFLKFGSTSPYVHDWRLVQRAVYASGVLGQGERVADALVPLYPQREDGLDKAWNTILGESGPTIRNISTGLDALGDVTEGNTERALDKGLKLGVPGLSVLTGTRKAIVKASHGDEDNYINKLLNGEYF